LYLLFIKFINYLIIIIKTMAIMIIMMVIMFVMAITSIIVIKFIFMDFEVDYCYLNLLINENVSFRILTYISSSNYITNSRNKGR